MAPALPTLKTLVQRLEDEDDGRFLYRGQSRNYPALLPSATRGVAVPIPDDPPAYRIARGRQFAEETVRQSEQQKLRHELVRRLGVPVGNLFAQQYLVTSDVVDATSKPSIAAFFASRRHSRAAHVDRQEEPGVIYRWPKPDPDRNLQELRHDLSLGLLTPLDHPNVEPLPVKFEIAKPGSEEARRCRDAPNGSLLLRPELVSVREIQTFVEGELRRTPRLGELNENDFHPFTGFRESRWMAQAGGMIRPATRFPAFFHGAEGGLDIAFDEELGVERARNLEVHITRPDIVVDSRRYSAEAFEFRHSPYRVAKHEPDGLWPDIASDPMFAWMCSTAWEAAQHYFDEVRANTPWDQWVGLIDRGYFRDSDDEWELRSEWLEFRRLIGTFPSAAWMRMLPDR